jgi:hypothetical protein
VYRNGGEEGEIWCGDEKEVKKVKINPNGIPHEEG